MTRDTDLAQALSHHQAGRLEQAEGLYRALIGANPDDPDPRHLLGLIHLSRNEVEAAVGQIARAAAIVPGSARVQVNLGEALFRANRYAEAAAAMRRAVEIDPSQATAWHRLGRTLAILGQTAEAAASLRRCLALDPHHVGALRDLADSGATDVIEPLRVVLARKDLPGRDRIDAGFALAAALDRAEDFDQAFAALAVANRLMRHHLAETGEAFDPVALRAYVDGRIAAFTQDRIERASAAGHPTEQPVFIVGMPRSGTTLVERMLASHPAIIGIGEGPAIGELAGALGQAEQPEAIRAVAERHVSWLRLMGGAAQRVVDKTPDNLFHLGAIACLFPRARIIVCRRDPRDICLSCHFQGFALPMPYTTDLGDCALRVQEADRMLVHWKDVLPLPMLEVDYKAVVADPEREGKRMLAFLGLPWDAARLGFHSDPGIVTSASVWQVRRPVYGGSSGRWRRYERHLGPLLAAFGRDRSARRRSTKA